MNSIAESTAIKSYNIDIYVVHQFWTITMN